MFNVNLHQVHGDASADAQQQVTQVADSLVDTVSEISLRHTKLKTTVGVFARVIATIGAQDKKLFLTHPYKASLKSAEKRNYGPHRSLL